jgi:hypothetical protein
MPEPMTVELVESWPPPPWLRAGATEPLPEALLPPPPPHLDRVVFTVTGHGLYYVHRDGQGMTVLDRGAYRPGEMPVIPQPERAMLAALLRWTLSQLDLMDLHERGEL